MSVHEREVRLLDHAAGQLDEAGRAELEEHLQTCGECRQAVDELRTALGAAAMLPRYAGDDAVPMISARGSAATVASLDQPQASHAPIAPAARPHGAGRPWLRAAAVVLVALGIAFVAALLVHDTSRQTPNATVARIAPVPARAAPLRVLVLDAPGANVSVRRRTLAEALRADPSPAVRVVAAQELAALADGSTQDVLLGALRAERSPVVQAWLLVSLAQIADAGVMREVREWSRRTGVAPEVADVVRTISSE